MRIAETLKKCITMLENITTMCHLQQIQAQMTKTALDHYPLPVSKLILVSAISDHGDLDYASAILTDAQNPTHFMWNTIIRGFSQSQEPEKALFWYSKMLNNGLLPDKFTFPFLLKTCSRLFDLRKGQEIHCQIIKIGPVEDPHIDTSLLYFYTSCGELSLAKIIFEEIDHRNSVTWNAMISGCVRSGKFNEALINFRQMRLTDENPDGFSFISVFSACAHLGALFWGKWVHCLAYRTGFCKFLPLGNALVDLYGKCGNISDAWKMFDEMSERNVVSWSTIIDICAMHGQGGDALNALDDMQRAGSEPDDLTFTSLLCACSHAGFVYEGKKLFQRMKRDYKINPKIQHYGCMVDLLGKAGDLEEAYELIRAMPIKPDAAIWRSFVDACMFHGDFGFAEIGMGQLRSLNCEDNGDLVMLSNLYARLGRWVDVERVRSGARKKPSYSFIEVDSVVNEFVTGDMLHPQIYEIYSLINQMVGQLGYDSGTW